MKTLRDLFIRITLSRKRNLPIYILLVLSLSCTEDDNPITDDAPYIPNLTIDFTKVLGGSENDTFKAIVVSQDGGFAMLGDSQSVDGDIIDNDTQINKIWFVKTDRDGELEFSKTYGGSEDSRGTDIITTLDGGYAILGYSESDDGDFTQNNGFYDHWIAKLNSNGDLLWQKSFGFSGSDQANALIQTTDGGFFTAGFLDVSASNGEGNDGILSKGNNANVSRSTLHGVGEFWGHKLDANGNLEWRRYFGGSSNDRAYDVVQAPDGGILMIGNSESNDFDISNAKGSYDFWAVRLDNQGNLLWEKSLGGSQIDIAYSVTASNNDGYIIVGDTRSNDGDITNFRGSADVWIVNLSDDGGIVWENTLGGSNFDTARSITRLPNGYAISGASRSNDEQVSENNGQNDFWVTLIDDAGLLIDEISIGGNNQDFGYGITSTTTGDIIVVGDTASIQGNLTTANGQTDAVLIKIKQ